MERCEEPDIFDHDSNAFTDFNNYYTSLVHGHVHAPTVKAARDQFLPRTAIAYQSWIPSTAGDYPAILSGPGDWNAHNTEGKLVH